MTRVVPSAFAVLTFLPAPATALLASATALPAFAAPPRVAHLSPVTAPFRRRAQAFHVFGPDNRRPLQETGYPWSAVGRLDLGNGGWCTATLVAEDLAVTAAHCVIDPATSHPFPTQATFHPVVRQGEEQRAIAVIESWWGTRQPLTDRAHDWAVVRLAEPVGAGNGWMAFATEAEESLDLWRGRLTLVGHSLDFHGGRIAGVDSGCALLAKEESYYLHTCDANPGASGAALWLSPEQEGEKATIVALHSAGSFGVNLAVPVAEVRTKVCELRGAACTR